MQWDLPEEEYWKQVLEDPEEESFSNVYKDLDREYRKHGLLIKSPSPRPYFKIKAHSKKLSEKIKKTETRGRKKKNRFGSKNRSKNKRRQ